MKVSGIFVAKNYEFLVKNRWNYKNLVFYFKFWSRDIQHEWDIAFSTVFNAKKGLFLSPNGNLQN